jgi:hypothetical protein
MESPNHGHPQAGINTMPSKKHTAKKTPAKKAASKPVSLSLIPDQLAPLVIRLRRENVILDADIAALYGVETKRLNEAVKRNIERFPADFMFQLTEEELENLRSQIVTSSPGSISLRSQFATLNAETDSLRSQSVTPKRGQHRKYLPYAFTEQGVAMLSSVLRSPRAVEVNIAIMRTFVPLRSLMQSNKPWLGLVVPVRRGDILSPLFRRRIHPHPKNSASTPSRSRHKPSLPPITDHRSPGTFH